MKTKTKFHKLLKDAVIDDTALVTVINKIMPMIDHVSKDNNSEIDEDLKSILITYSIELIRKKNYLKNFKFVVPVFTFSSAVNSRRVQKTSTMDSTLKT